MERYQELFPDDKSKAEAFDQIAEHYYARNFGTMSKTDFEVLLFHLYIEQVLKQDETDWKAYSDFRLSKELGISQSRVSNLKVKKQLQYPYKDFDWKRSFARVTQSARYEGGKILIQIPDKNLFYEIKNAVEESGGYIDMTLTPSLLKISPEYFLDLLTELPDEDGDRKSIREKVRKELRKHQNQDDQAFLDEKPLGYQIKNLSLDAFTGVLEAVLANGSNPVIVPVVKALCSALKRKG